MDFQRRSGIAPLIGVLLVLSTSVLLSIGLFTYSLGFLGNLGSISGAQQPLQNQATMARITIEEIVASAYSSGVSDGSIVIYVRNVGAFFPLDLGSVTITALPLNTGLKTSIISTQQGGTWSIPITNMLICSRTTDATNCSTGQPLTKLGNLATAKIFIIWPKGSTFSAGDFPISGDTLTMKAVTTVGAAAVETKVVP